MNALTVWAASVMSLRMGTPHWLTPVAADADNSEPRMTMNWPDTHAPATTATTQAQV
ncbi:hypothetical protein GZ998_03170 [Actinomyces sp. 594]|nr:hypothetical protein [Actinomyces sp. 594]